MGDAEVIIDSVFEPKVPRRGPKVIEEPLRNNVDEEIAQPQQNIKWSRGYVPHDFLLAPWHG